MPVTDENTPTAKSESLGAANRARYLVNRVRGFDASSVRKRAREVSTKHHKVMPIVLVDMLWSAAFRQTPFQDYVDWDFAILSRAERATYMTHAISHQLSMKFDHPDYRVLFHDKIEFNRTFNEFLGREWLDVRTASVAELRAFVERHGRVMGKVPVSDSGHGVERYEAGTIQDWHAFRVNLVSKGQTLVEECIVQHPTLAAICPGTANTTRVTGFFDGK
jgi:hypothetical protein